jgi:putative endonuclease
LAFFTYIVASSRNGTLYTGSTDNLIKRIIEHREKRRDGFTAKHNVAILVWYEIHESRHAAFVRERRIKEWKRVWKLELIERTNPGWIDLFEKLF